MTKQYFVIFLLAVFLNKSHAQEYLGGLSNNPVLISSEVVEKHKKQSSTLLKLPFFDDFSYNSTRPSALLWDETNFAFINNSYGRGLVSTGVATFDAVNKNGKFNANSLSSVYMSDELKSHAIDLSNADMNSLWLSFYYQPQGYGNAPEKNDSLILQVSSEIGVWENIWYANGMEFEFFRDSILQINPQLEGEFLEFDYVMVKLDSQKYKSSNFKFRFVNYVSLSSEHESYAVNCDHWNIDYVYLNDGRDSLDVGMFDVACVEPPRLFLRNFESVPWTHYTEVQRSELAKKDLLVRNNDTEVRIAERAELLINEKESGELLKATYLASWSVDPLETEKNPWKYDADPLFEVKAVDELHINYQLKLTVEDSVPQNNIASKDYHFTNYYAYDDGTAENTYGIDASGAKVAYRFKSYVPDTLKGVSISFFDTYPTGEGATAFNLCVWSDNNGIPGELLLVDEGIKPEFDSVLNKPFEYALSQSIPVDGDFYIGWEQKQALRMNVGFDRNRNSAEHLYYNLHGYWENTSFSGSLLMRPLIGHLTPNAIQIETKAKNAISVYPNPASSSISVLGIESVNMTSVKIFNSVGKLIYLNNILPENIDISFFENGVYILSLMDEKGLPYISRFVISK